MGSTAKDDPRQLVLDDVNQPRSDSGAGARDGIVGSAGVGFNAITRSQSESSAARNAGGDAPVASRKARTT